MNKENMIEYNPLLSITIHALEIDKKFKWTHWVQKVCIRINRNLSKFFTNIWQYPEKSEFFKLKTSIRGGGVAGIMLVGVSFHRNLPIFSFNFPTCVRAWLDEWYMIKHCKNNLQNNSLRELILRNFRTAYMQTNYLL